ncbi:MAG: hypothetical protein ACE5DS_02540, partial [Kiloniellaceae bacterium]
MAAHDPAMPGDTSVIVEFYRVGTFVKVSAIDPASLTEVSIVGAPAAGEAARRAGPVSKQNNLL